MERIQVRGAEVVQSPWRFWPESFDRQVFRPERSFCSVSPIGILRISGGEAWKALTAGLRLRMS